MPIEFDGQNAIKRQFLCAVPVKAPYELFRVKNNEKKGKHCLQRWHA